MRLESGASAAKVTTAVPWSMARLIGSMNGSEFIGWTRMPAGFLGQSLVERGDLLVDIIFRRAGIGGLAAELLACLLEHLIDREPIFDARDHDVHDVFFTRLAAERVVRLCTGNTSQKRRCKDRQCGRA